jgi:hypothetical protein
LAEYHNPVMRGDRLGSDVDRVNEQEGRRGMEQETNTIEIDDRFLGEWLDFGFREMRAYLEKHARFARYLDGHDARS